MKILFTNAGRRTYLIEYALDLVQQGYCIDIYVGDASRNTAAMHVSEKVNGFLTPRVDEGEEAYAQGLLDLCRKEKIDVVVPLMDYEIPVLGYWRERFLQLGTKVWVSSPEVAEKCLNKRKCYVFCEANGFPMPRSWFDNEPDESRLPVIYKKVCGSGSVGQQLIVNRQDLAQDHRDGFYQTYVHGTECGIDILNDLEGRYVHSYYREKLLMRSGETDKARTFASERFDDFARRISEKLGHVGNLDLDVIVTDNDDIYPIDLNPRFGGGYPFTHHAGFNYLKAIVDMSLGKTPIFPSEGRDIVGMKGINLLYYNS